MKIKYLRGEHLQEASEISAAEDFITTAKALQFFGARTLLLRGEFIPSTSVETAGAEALSIEATFDKLVGYMLTGVERVTDGYGATDLNPHHTNYVLDSLYALSRETTDTLSPEEQVFAQYVASAKYILDHLEVEGFPDSVTVESTLASTGTLVTA